MRQEGKSISTFDFKHDYKATQDYEDVINEIHSIVNNQIKLDDIFREIDITSIYDKPNEFDFNDRYAAERISKAGVKKVACFLSRATLIWWNLPAGRTAQRA